MTRFLSDAAHELKTPLAGIQAASESLMSLPPEAVNEREELEYLLGREASRAGVLVGSLLEAARVDAGVALHPEYFDLHELLTAERSRIGLTRPDVRVRVRSGSLRVMADRPAVTSAVRNVLENAARMAGSGGWVEMWVTDRPGGPQTADQAEIWVIDSGPGVAPEDRERIFDRLVRLDVPQNRQGGSGLGLPIARGYLRAQGGDLVCTDPPSHYRPPDPNGRAGAAFKLTLPVTLRQATASGSGG
jgi:signal transduction histidine kinase